MGRKTGNNRRKGSIHYWTYRGREVKLLMMGLSWAVVRYKDGGDPFVVDPGWLI